MERSAEAPARSRGAALVTGASSGIGRELARLCAKGGQDVVLVARTESALAELAAELTRAHRVRATVVRADLTDATAPDAIAERVAASEIAISTLINNAGFGVSAPFAESDVKRQLELLQVNIVALTHLTRLFLPGMLARRSGQVLNVASTAGFVPGPRMATYYASKAYVVSFTEALSIELAGSGVTATVLVAGPTETNFGAVAGSANSHLFKTPGVMQPVQVARAGYDAMLRGARHEVPGLNNKLVVFSSRVTPRVVLGRIAGWLNS